MAEPLHYRSIAKFELHELIGEGAMGVVWKAYDSVLRRYVALKLMSTGIAKTHDMRERFLREARAAGALQHPNIVTVYDLGEAEGQLYIAMELVEGRDLSELIASLEPLALERKLDIVIEVLEGLAYAHERGVVHRDIKPSNVRIAVDGRVKIMDFGIARLQSAELTRSGTIVGTPTYMAPEQVTNGHIGPVTDLFAVGCVLYELLTYRKPFEAETLHGVLYQVLTTDPKPLRSMAPSIPASLERVVAKAMSKVPEERYASARQMQQSLLGIRAALSGATDTTTERLAPGWSALPAPVLRLLTHAPMRWRVGALAALAVVAAALLYVQLSAPGPGTSPAAAESTATAEPAPPPSPAPAGLDPASVALRDSALAAQARARRAGAMKNNVPSVVGAEQLLQRAEGTLRVGDAPGAAQSYRDAITQYRRALRETETLRREADRTIARVKPTVGALTTQPDSTRAAVFLSRAESLFRVRDYNPAKAAALDAEQVAAAAGATAFSPQPADARRAIEVLLDDLAHAVASERVANIRALYPTITRREVTRWEATFRDVSQLTARYTIVSLSVQGAAASADVQAAYRFVSARGGVPGEDRNRQAMEFTKTASGWRIKSIVGR